MLIPFAGEPRSRLRGMLELACVLGAGACIALGARACDRPARVVPIVVPAIAAPPQIVVKPAPVTIEPAPPPPPAPAPAPVPEPRALAPYLDARCIVRERDSDPEAVDPACNWDHGFPAISVDGKTIVLYDVPEDARRGNPGLSIEFLDVAGGRVTSAMTVLSPDEWSADAIPALLPRVARRAAAAQRALDARGYRPLASLAAIDGSSAVRAEFSADAMRVVDPARGLVLWQGRLPVPNPSALGGECSGWDLASSQAWWDAKTGTVIVDQMYATGGCMCDAVHEYLVRHVTVDE